MNMYIYIYIYIYIYMNIYIYVCIYIYVFCNPIIDIKENKIIIMNQLLIQGFSWRSLRRQN